MGIASTPLQNSIQKTLGSTFAAEATTAVLNEDVSALFSGVSATNPGVFVVDRVDANGTATPTKREYCTFTGVSTTTLTGVTKNADSSGSDQEHATGAIVEFVPDVLWAKSVKDTFETQHTGAGAHGVVTATSVNIGSTIAITGVLDEDNMATDSAVKLATQQSIKAYVDSKVLSKSTADEIQAGTEDAKYISPKGLRDAGIFDSKSVVVQVLDGGVGISTGDGKAYITIPVELNGMNLTGVNAQSVTASYTATSTLIQIRNVTDGQDMLTWPIQIDALENNSASAASIAIINTSYDDVATDDLLAIDIDQTSATAPKGLIVRLRFALP